MSERCILHCDLNNFFASVECLSHPEWKDVPMAVCGSQDDRHGIVLAKNEAAKKYGVRTGEVIWQVRKKCANIIIAPPHYKDYLYYSKEVRKIYDNYTDLVEPFGLDECWLDVGGSRLLFGSGEVIADKIREDVKKRTGLTISVGVSFNKVFAKLASDLKKPDATTIVPYKDFGSVIYHINAGNLLGVGRSTQKKLNSLGISTIGELARSGPETLSKLLGKNGLILWRYANGLDYSAVIPVENRVLQKSIGRSVTGKRDLSDEYDIKNVLTALCEDVSRRLREQEFLANLLTVYIRYNNLKTETHQKPLCFPLRLSTVLKDEALGLVLKNWDGTPLRSIGVSVSELQSQNASIQYNMYCDVNKYERLEKKESGMDTLRARFGSGIIVRASQMRPIFDGSNGGDHCSFSHMAQ